MLLNMLIITLLFRSTGTVNCTVRLSCDYQNDSLHVTLTELVSPPSFLFKSVALSGIRCLLGLRDLSRTLSEFNAQLKSFILRIKAFP